MCFPEACRRRMLMLVCDPSPLFLDQLSAQERADYFDVAAWTVTTFEKMGVAAQEVGKDFTVECYQDHTHLTKQGDERLAFLVAPRVRELAAQLGYIRYPGY
jgi:hypothetical protein